MSFHQVTQNEIFREALAELGAKREGSRALPVVPSNYMTSCFAVYGICLISFFFGGRG